MDILNIRDGRHAPIAIQVIPWSRIKFIVCKCPTKVARTKVRNEIGHATISDCYPEAVGMADQPVCHEAPVTPASYSHTLLVDISLLQQGIHSSHNIQRILLSPGSSNC